MTVSPFTHYTHNGLGMAQNGPGKGLGPAYRRGLPAALRAVLQGVILHKYARGKGPAMHLRRIPWAPAELYDPGPFKRRGR